MTITFDHSEDLVRILRDASTPVQDREQFLDLFSALQTTASLLPDQLKPVAHVPELYELQLRWEHEYGFLLEERSGGYEVIAYYRVPPLIGYDRSSAIDRALKRRAER